MKPWLIASFAAFCLACADSESPAGFDAGATGGEGGDAGTLEPCEGARDPISNACMSDGDGERVICPEGRFFDRHTWVAQAQTDGSKVFYVAATGSGDGSSATSPISDPSTLLDGTETAVLILAKGEHAFALPSEGNLSIVGPCASLTTLRVTGGLQAEAGATRRLFGLTLVNDEAEGALLRAEAAGDIVIDQARLRSAGEGLVVNGAANLALTGNGIGQINGTALRATGTLSDIIVDDNHFVGPLTGDGVWVGPLTGDGVWRIAGNSFGDIEGTGLKAVGISTTGDIIVDDNHFVGPLTGDGVWVGPLTGDGVWRIAGNNFEKIGGNGLSVGPLTGDGVWRIADNNFTQVGGDAITVMESATSGEVRGNIIDANAMVGGDALLIVGSGEGAEIVVRENSFVGHMGTGLLAAEGASKLIVHGNTIGATGQLLSGIGIGFFDLVGPGDVRVNVNTIVGAQTLGITAQRSSAAMLFEANVVQGVHSGEVGPTAHASADGVGFYDVGNINFLGNTTSDCGRAALVIDQSAWGTYFNRRDLSGPTLIELGDNNFGDQDTCVQGADHDDGTILGNAPSTCDAARGYAVDRSGRAFRCGNGRIDGAEECDPGDENDPHCDPSCRFVRGQSLAMGNDFFCGIGRVGQLYCGGMNAYGQVQPGGAEQIQSFVLRQDLQTSLLEVAAGEWFACGRTAGGNVSCWGKGDSGRMGRPGASYEGNEAGFVVINGDGDPLTGARGISLGTATGCAVLDDGTVRCWGITENGLLGTGPVQAMNVEVASRLVQWGQVNGDALNPITDAVSVAVGDTAACLITAEKDLWCWGLNDSRQLGLAGNELPTQACPGRDANNLCSTHAVQTDVTGVDRVALGGKHGCAIIEGGQVVCWGNNSRGQVTGSVTRANMAPVEMNGMAGAQNLALGTNHSCALIAGGEVRCWGDNQYQQLGRVANSNGPDAVFLAGTETKLDGRMALSSRDNETCAMAANGHLTCWGTVAMGAGNSEIPGAHEVANLPR